MNITAFMNLMVILVPFLLITAVFSRLAILELNLPSSDTGQNSSDQRELQLEVVIRKDAIAVADRGQPSLVIKNKPEGYDLADLSRLLQKIKGKYPEKVDVTILLEPDISYDVLVKVMDTVRATRVKKENILVNAELFPEISIGDAPVKAPIKQAMR